MRASTVMPVSGIISIVIVLALAPAAMATPDPEAGMHSAKLEAVPADAWSDLAGRRIFFGHQSVGANILQGIAELAGRDGVPSLAVVEAGPDGAAPSSGFVHAAIGRNGDPEAKMDDFARILAGDTGGAVDIALMKLCYVDIGESTDVEALFHHYQRTVEAVRAARPALTIVHMTTPLQGPPGGFKQSVRQFMKNLTGRGGTGPARNAKREQYNELMRRAYGGREPLFDLAAVESTRRDGRVTTFKHAGRAVPRLAPEYTYDGGHLNDDGRRHVASHLLAFLAGLTAKH